jgi:UDP-N-acetylglucosamine--N-acetylmuramyl-(pentapeptide) pyrophosphoryl-undecaprenol N-acetylglucosamine transferase
MECRKVPPQGIPMDVVSISGLRGKGAMRWISMPFLLARAVIQALGVIGRLRPACAISFGGYAAGPGGLAARLRGVPLLVHEQNRIPGMTNRTLAKWSRRVLQAFPDTWPEALNPETVGNPVRQSVVDLPAPGARMADRQGPCRVLVTGGSQGARTLNRAVPAAVASLASSVTLQVRHQAGKNDLETTRDAYSEAGVEAEVTEFIEDMASAYAWADLVVCRSGALTVSELAAAGVASILVPYPHAVDDHQTRNAEVLVEAGAARLVPETELSPERLARVLQELTADRVMLTAMGSGARAAAVPDSAERVASLCRECLSS